MLKLSQHNYARHQQYAAFNAQKSRPNNIACETCGAELHDSDPTITLTSNPPQKRVHCPKCGFTGLRVA